jgi:hypothetical protein
METYKLDINAHDLQGKVDDIGELFDLISGLASERTQRPMNQLSPSLSILNLDQDQEPGYRAGASFKFHAHYDEDKMVNLMAKLDGSKDLSRALLAWSHVHVMVVARGGRDVRLYRKLVRK